MRRVRVLKLSFEASQEAPREFISGLVGWVMVVLLIKRPPAREEICNREAIVFASLLPGVPRGTYCD